jgi:hypothetical protein
MAENKQRSPGKGNRSEKQRAAQAEASFEESFDESTASTDYGNDVKEIRSFVDDNDESLTQRTSPRSQNTRQQNMQDQDTRSQSRSSGERSRQYESDGWADQRNSGEQRQSYSNERGGQDEQRQRYSDERSEQGEQRQSGQRSIQDMLSDRMDDLKDYAGNLVNGTFDKLKDEWKYNRKSLVRRAAVAAVVTTAGVALAVAMRNNRKSKSLLG